MLHISERSSNQSNRHSPRALLVLASGFLVTFCSVGFINAFGVFQEYYGEVLLSSKTPTEIAWIGSFNIFCMFSGTFISGFLTDKYGPRVCMHFLPTPYSN